VYEWRSSFGSGVIAMLNTFFSENDEFKADNESRVAFSTTMLESYMFLYADTEADSREVGSLL
jgi:hypothetical protein